MPVRGRGPAGWQGPLRAAVAVFVVGFLFVWLVKPLGNPCPDLTSLPQGSTASSSPSLAPPGSRTCTYTATAGIKATAKYVPWLDWIVLLLVAAAVAGVVRMLSPAGRSAGRQRAARPEREPRVERLPRGEREPRVERLPRAEREPRVERLPRAEREPRVDRLPRAEREPRVERPSRAERAPRAERRSRAERAPSQRPPRPEPPAAERPSRAERTPRSGPAGDPSRGSSGERDAGERERARQERAARDRARRGR